MRRTSIIAAIAIAALVALAPPSGAASTRGQRPVHLACEAVRTDGGPGVACRWRPVRAASGYLLWRYDRQDGRQVIFRTDDPAATRHLDTDVERGRTYGYVVVAVDDDGAPVTRSRMVTVTVGDDGAAPHRRRARAVAAVPARR